MSLRAFLSGLPLALPRLPPSRLHAAFCIKETQEHLGSVHEASQKINQGGGLKGPRINRKEVDV